MECKNNVYVIDDDEDIREVVAQIARRLDAKTHKFATVQNFLDVYRGHGCSCLVLDVHMPGINGLELLCMLKERDAGIAPVVITGRGDIKMAVKAMKLGAVDFIKKPFTVAELTKSIQKALQISKQKALIQNEKAILYANISRLTERELAVIRLMIKGLADKEIAAQLGVSRRAISFHRNKSLQKLETDTIVELASVLARFNVSI